MNQNNLNEFMLGACVIACAAIGLFFLRFYRKTRDGLLAIFAVSFWILGFNWLALAFIQTDEVRTWLYAVRLVAFVLLLAGIVQKNLSRPT